MFAAHLLSVLITFLSLPLTFQFSNLPSCTLHPPPNLGWGRQQGWPVTRLLPNLLWHAFRPSLFPLSWCWRTVTQAERGLAAPTCHPTCPLSRAGIVRYGPCANSVQDEPRASLHPCLHFHLLYNDCGLHHPLWMLHSLQSSSPRCHQFFR